MPVRDSRGGVETCVNIGRVVPRLLVLGELLGLTAERIAELADSGVLSQHVPRR